MTISVCLSVREQPSINPELRVQSLPKLALHVICDRGSVIVRRTSRYVIYCLQFMDDLIFARKAAIRNRRRQKAYKSYSQ